MKIENQKIAAQYWADFPARGPAPVALAQRHSHCVAGKGSPAAPV
jgi:hypothetical protein